MAFFAIGAQLIDVFTLLAEEFNKERRSSSQGLFVRRSPSAHRRSLAELTHYDSASSLYRSIHGMFVSVLARLAAAYRPAPMPSASVGKALFSTLMEALGEDRFAVLIDHCLCGRPLVVRRNHASLEAFSAGICSNLALLSPCSTPPIAEIQSEGSAPQAVLQDNGMVLGAFHQFSLFFLWQRLKRCVEIVQASGESIAALWISTANVGIPAPSTCVGEVFKIASKGLASAVEVLCVQAAVQVTWGFPLPSRVVSYQTFQEWRVKVGVLQKASTQVEREKLCASLYLGKWEVERRVYDAWSQAQ